MNTSQKLDHIIDKINDVRIKTAKIEQHLVTLNGTVKEHDGDIQWIKNKFWIAIGASSTLTVVFVFVTKAFGLW